VAGFLECFWQSISQGDLDELSESLPLPGTFQQILHDIYKENNVDFVVGKKIVRIIPTSGVSQGDLLSTTVYNLAAEPIIRAEKSFENYGYPIFSRLFKITAYADDIAVLPSSAEELQIIVDHILSVTTDLGLRFP